MAFFRLHRRFSAWLAMLALVLGALAPTVAQAMAAGSDDADWQRVCSVSGMVWVKADTGELSDRQPDGGAPLSDASQHCAWCTLHGGVAGLPAADPVPGLPARLTDLPPAFYLAPMAASVWMPAHSRGPPRAS
jgi:Protein of unknown function (DUF2946)